MVEVLGEARRSGEGRGGGGAEWNERNSVDVSEWRGEASFGRNHAEAEVAMVDRGELRRDEAREGAMRSRGPRALLI